MIVAVLPDTIISYLPCSSAKLYIYNYQAIWFILFIFTFTILCHRHTKSEIFNEIDYMVCNIAFVSILIWYFATSLQFLHIILAILKQSFQTHAVSLKCFCPVSCHLKQNDMLWLFSSCWFYWNFIFISLPSFFWVCHGLLI